MITIKDFLECIHYKITDGSDYGWRCYGNNAHMLDYWNGKTGDDESVSVSIVFDTKTHIVYQMEAWDTANNREYRWIHPLYRDAIAKEAKARNVDHGQSIDDREYINLDVPDDMLDKASAIVDGRKYDERIMVTLDLSGHEIFQLMTMAHENDLTFNQFVEKVLSAEIARLNEQPTWP